MIPIPADSKTDLRTSAYTCSLLDLEFEDLDLSGDVGPKRQLTQTIAR
jgi:hypothetical protein